MLEKVNEKLVYAVVFAKCKVRDFMYREDGDVNIVSIVVLIGIAIILAIVFRKAMRAYAGFPSGEDYILVSGGTINFGIFNDIHESGKPKSIFYI